MLGGPSSFCLSGDDPFIECKCNSYGNLSRLNCGWVIALLNTRIRVHKRLCGDAVKDNDVVEETWLTKMSRFARDESLTSSTWSIQDIQL